MESVTLAHKIALGLIPGIGDINARRLVSHLGGVEAVFIESLSALRKIPGIGENLSKYIAGKSYMERAEREAEFVQKNGIKTFFYLDDDYPSRLKNCDDSPVVFFFRGNADLNTRYILSVVGTRRATPGGRDYCKGFITELAASMPELLIISGLAYGIDITAHKAALSSGLMTVGVLAHGLNTIYPSAHHPISKKMINSGGLVSDFLSDALPERNNFIKRNRIIAGISDATLVVESGITGGALITADMAGSYNRDVFAIPGRPDDVMSAGCNDLIARNKAGLVSSASELMYQMGWSALTKPRQGNLFHNLTGNERVIFDYLMGNGNSTVDEICASAGIPVHKVSATLLGMELTGMVKCLPGNIYALS